MNLNQRVFLPKPSVIPVNDMAMRVNFCRKDAWDHICILTAQWDDRNACLPTAGVSSLLIFSSASSFKVRRLSEQQSGGRNCQLSSFGVKS